MRFTKMHGAGNDYVLVDSFRGELPPDLPALARGVSDRRSGVGADGLIVLEPDPGDSDFRMRVFNADGSEAEMCGNGIRCAFKYLRDREIVTGDRAWARTGAGRLELREVAGAREPETFGVFLEPPRVGHSSVARAGGDPLRVRVDVEGRSFEAACISIGNPHAVVFLSEPVERFPVERFGRPIERHRFFPERTNVEFVECLDPHAVNQRTWERGSGETLACGTGACAVVVAGCLTGRLRSPVDVHLRGGDLRIEWPGEGERVYMEGPAVEVFSGDW